MVVIEWIDFLDLIKLPGTFMLLLSKHGEREHVWPSEDTTYCLKAPQPLDMRTNKQPTLRR